MKRLIAFSDGLWTSPAVPGDSNIGLLAGALSIGSAAGAHQVSLGDPFQSLDRAEAGAYRVQFLKESICSLYLQLAQNYAPGDTLWFFGFGRGSFVVRACIGMIRNTGLLTRPHLHRVEDAWRIYRTRWGADAGNARVFRHAYSHLPRVRFLGVFDTVGTSGVPRTRNADGGLSFHDTVLSRSVEYACHALAIDEQRREFDACLWRTSADHSQTEQCWFTGNHRDMGGIRGNPALADLALGWMAGRAAALGLALDGDLLARGMNARERGARKKSEKHGARRCAAGFRPMGIASPDETLHPSAEQRFLRDERYRPANLKAFVLRDDQIQLPL